MKKLTAGALLVSLLGALGAQNTFAAVNPECVVAALADNVVRRAACDAAFQTDNDNAEAAFTACKNQAADDLFQARGQCQIVRNSSAIARLIAAGVEFAAVVDEAVVYDEVIDSETDLTEKLILIDAASAAWNSGVAAIEAADEAALAARTLALNECNANADAEDECRRITCDYLREVALNARDDAKANCEAAAESTLQYWLATCVIFGGS